MRKVFLDALVLVLHIYYCFLLEKTNIQKFEMGTSTGRLGDHVTGRPGDQMIVHGT